MYHYSKKNLAGKKSQYPDICWKKCLLVIKYNNMMIINIEYHYYKKIVSLKIHHNNWHNSSSGKSGWRGKKWFSFLSLLCGWCWARIKNPITNDLMQTSDNWEGVLCFMTEWRKSLKTGWWHLEVYTLTMCV